MVVSWQDRQIDCGRLDSRHCPICERERPFHLVVSYRAEGFYLALCWVTRKEYWYLCEVCHRGQPVDAAWAEATLGGSPIPFLHRYGAALFGVAVAALLTVCVALFWGKP
jgi:hypothetical protein